jgi:hypothetical protein
VAKARLIAVHPLRHGYLDGDRRPVEVVYAEGESIDDELFEPHELDQLKQSGAVKTKKELKEAEAEAETETAPPIPEAAEIPDKKKKAK